MTSKLMRQYLLTAAPDRDVVDYDLNAEEDLIRQTSVHGFIPTVNLPFYGLSSRAKLTDGKKLPVYCTEPIQYNNGYLRAQRIIVCAANRFHLDNGQSLVIAASRHGSLLMHDVANYLEANGLRANRRIPTRVDQGFIDNFDNFWTRREAMLIAMQANQVRFDTNGPDSSELYSEGLY